MLQRSPRLVVWANVKFLYFYVVPAVCRFRSLPFPTLVLPPPPPSPLQLTVTFSQIGQRLSYNYLFLTNSFFNRLLGKTNSNKSQKTCKLGTNSLEYCKHLLKSLTLALMVSVDICCCLPFEIIKQLYKQTD